MGSDNGLVPAYNKPLAEPTLSCMVSDDGSVPTGNRPLPEAMMNCVGSDNGLVPTGNKPLPEPMLNCVGSDNGLVPTGNKPSFEPMLNYMVSDNGLVPTGNKPLLGPMLNRVILSGTNNFACLINTNSKVKEDNMYFIYVQGNDIGNDIAIRPTCLNVPESGRYWSCAGSSGLVRARFWYITAWWYGYTTLLLHIVHIHTESNDVNVVIVHVDTHIHIYIYILTYKHKYAGMEMANFDEIYRHWRHQDGT